MNASEDYVFQIMEIVNSKKPWIVAGLAFDTIRKDDVLFLSLSETDYINVRVIEITLYGKQVDEITRGLTARLILDSETDFLISEVIYLYKQN